MFRRWFLPFSILVFALFSLVTLRSVAPSLMDKQALFFLVGAGIFFVTANISFHRWERRSFLLYLLVVGGLIATHVVGRVTRGTTSWIPIGAFHIQPSQIAAGWAGLYLCTLLSKEPVRSLQSAAKALLLTLLPAALIFTEPDLGTTLVYIAAIGSVLFLSNTKTSYLVISVVGAVLISILGWNFVLRPYQKDRITSFLNIEQNQTGAGYNAMQSVIAVGSGELYGRGIGQGVQSHLQFLPERQTDFVFASFAEETGFVGASLVILLYAMEIAFIIFIGFTARSEPEQLFCFLTATMLAVQSGINIGMNMGLLPITGIPLPFFSYGGSSILSLCFQLGSIQSIIMEFRKKEVLYIR